MPGFTVSKMTKKKFCSFYFNLESYVKSKQKKCLSSYQKLYLIILYEKFFALHLAFYG